MFKNRFTLYILTSIMLGLLVAPQQILAETAYQIVEQELLKTLTPSTEQSRHTDIATLEQKNEQAAFSPAELGEYDQYAIALNLLTNNVDQSATTVIDTKFIKKMELLCGGGAAEEHLFGKLDMTQSLFGKLALAKMLVNPTRSSSVIEGRQAFIKGLLTADAIELDALFGSLRPLEADIISYWKEENEATKALFEQLYFGNYLSFLNQSTVSLELKTRVRNLGTFLMVSLPVLPEIGATIYQKGKQTRPNDIADAVARYAKSFYPFPLAFKDKSDEEVLSILKNNGQPESFGDQCKALDAQVKDGVQSYENFYKKLYAELNEIKEKQGELFEDQEELDKLQAQITTLSNTNIQAQTKPVKIALGAGKGLITAIMLWQVKKAINSAQLNTATTDYLHARLINLASYINTIKQVHARLSTLDGAQSISAFATLTAYFNGTAPISDKAKQLLSMLECWTFQGNPSFFTLTGRVLAAHKLMQEVKDELAPFFNAAGELEAYYSVAKLYAQHQDTKAHYCFVEFAGSDKPYIQAEGFWNPFIEANTVVTNDIVLNNYATHHNVILTGPNTGGKSTIIKAVAINLLLAQTFGIAAADHMKLTPFAIINCYLNITDDISTGTSLFHAEIKRAKELVDQVKKLKSDEYCFTILDEVFSGTNAEGGSEAAYKFAHELGTSKNTILVIATHFANMIELEETSNFKNMSVTATVMENGTLNRPFKLENGPFHDPENTILKALLEQEGIFA